MEQHTDKQKEINIKACLKSPRYVKTRREFIKFIDEEAMAKGLGTPYPDKYGVISDLDANYPEEVSISIMESYMYRCSYLDEAMRREMDDSEECDQLKTLIATMNTIIMKEMMESIEERIQTLHEIVQEWSPHTEVGWNAPIFGDDLHAYVVLWDKLLVNNLHLDNFDNVLSRIYERFPLNRLKGEWWGYNEDNEGGEK